MRLVEAPEPRPSREVVAQIATGDRAGLQRAVAWLNDCDVAIVQHEYGIYGGQDGDEILPLLDGLRVPAIVVLHTVLAAADAPPTRGPRSGRGQGRRRGHDVGDRTGPARAGLRRRHAQGQRHRSRRPGTLPRRPGPRVVPQRPADGPDLGAARSGQGHRVGHRGDGHAARPRPAPHYVVAGQTHPKVVLHEGEAYRDGCCDQVARRSGWPTRSSFDGRYRDTDALAQLVESADVVLLPYDSIDQVTSGVLIEAVAAGKPVVATGFPHAVELLGRRRRIWSFRTADPARDRGGPAHPDHAGRLSPRDGARRRVERAPGCAGRPSPSSTAALAARADRGRRRGVISSPRGRHRCSTTCSGSPTSVACSSTRSCRVPRREHGYCVDDVARGLVVVCREPSSDFERASARTALSRLRPGRDRSPTARCHNRMDVDGAWRDEPALGDWWGRAVWGLGVAAAHAHSGNRAARRPGRLPGRRRGSDRRTAERWPSRPSARPRCCRHRARGPSRARAAADAVRRDRPGRAGPGVAVARAAAAIRQRHRGRGAHRRRRRAARRRRYATADSCCSEFLLKTETHDGHLSVTPVGGRGRGDVGPRFDQQPIEVAALADACASAYRATDDPRWLLGVRLAWNWFLGDNDASTPMFDAAHRRRL